MDVSGDEPGHGEDEAEDARRAMMSQGGDATPKGVRVIALAPDGTERNITEGVQVLYDLVIQSMDWGSGFLSVEDVRPVVDLAKWCGFEKYEAAEEYMAAELKQEKQRTCSHPGWREEPLDRPYLSSSPGREYVRRVCVECGLERIDAKPPRGGSPQPVTRRDPVRSPAASIPARPARAPRPPAHPLPSPAVERRRKLRAITLPSSSEGAPMATTTKPRSPANGQSRKGQAREMLSMEDRVSKARTIIATTKRKATRIENEKQPNRATAARNAMKLRSEALDQISDALAGRAA